MNDYLNQYNNWLPQQEKKFAYLAELNPTAYQHHLSITGTMTPVILGQSPYTSPFELYSRIRGEIDEVPDNFAFRRGRFNEQFVAEEFELQTHLKVSEGKTVQDGTRPWATAQIDRIVHTPDGDIPLEIKVLAAGKDQYGPGCEFNGNGEILTVDDKVSTFYGLQLHTQMGITGAPYGFLAVWFTFEAQIRIYRLEANADITAAIKEAQDHFLFDNVIPGVPPEQTEIVGSEPMHSKAKAVTATPEIVNLITDLAALKAQKSTIEGATKKLEEKLKLFMGDAGVCQDTLGQTLATITTVQSTRLDTKLLKDNFPEVYRKCAKLSFSNRLGVK